MPLLNERLQESLPGAIPQAPAQSKPEPVDVLAAAFRQNNLVSSLYQRTQEARLGKVSHPLPDYDPLDDVQGFEDFAPRFLESRSPEQTAQIKGRIQSELQDQDTIHRAGAWGFAASMAAGVSDPATLASLLIPVGGETRLLQLGSMIGTEFAVDAASELGFHSLQETRTIEQSAINIAGGVLLSGVLGSAITSRTGNFKELSKGIEEDFQAPIGSTAGAASRTSGTTLEQESISAGGEFLANTIGQISPLTRLMTSPTKASRIVVQDLAELPYSTVKNTQHIKTPDAVETTVRGYEWLQVRFAQHLDTGYLAYKQRVKAAGEPAISFKDFKDNVSGAMRRKDVSDIPEVATAAKWGRSNIIDPLTKLAQKNKLLGEELQTVGAASYLPRLYDAIKIKGNRGEWERTLKEEFQRQGLESAEVDGLVQQVTNTILGSTRGFVQLDPNIVVKAGALKERTLNVPDEVLEPFLVNDAEVVLARYIRTLSPQLEITAKFGDLDMKQAFQDVIDEYGVLQKRAGSDKEKAALDKRMKADIEDLTEIRDRILGKAGTPLDPDSTLVRGVRLFRQYNYARLLGSQALGSLADLGRVVTMNGMLKTGKALGVFATHAKAWNLARTDAKRLAIGLDWTLNTRGATLADIGEFAETPIEQYAQRASSFFTRVTGMATWNSSMKFLATALQQDHVLTQALKAEPSKNALTNLASMGIDRAMLKRIGTQFEKHGEDAGLKRARSELWTDKEAAATFENSMRKAADIAVLSKGAGDTPIFMSSELGKTIFQFKGFGMAAVNRLLIPAAQGLARGELAMVNGLTLMLALGTARYAAKQWTSDQPIETDWSTLGREAIDGAGLTAYIAEPYDVLSGMANSRYLPRFSRYTDRSVVETFAGPSAGSITDIISTTSGITKDGISQKDIHKFRKLLPYQNVFYLRRAINAFEEEAGDALGAAP